MRKFFVGSFEGLLNIVAILAAIIVVIGALGVMAQVGFLQGLVVLVMGWISLTLTLGMIYLMLAIHDNTKRTAEAMEALARRNP